VEKEEIQLVKKIIEKEQIEVVTKVVTKEKIIKELWLKLNRDGEIKLLKLSSGLNIEEFCNTIKKQYDQRLDFKFQYVDQSGTKFDLDNQEHLEYAFDDSQVLVDQHNSKKLEILVIDSGLRKIEAPTSVPDAPPLQLPQMRPELKRKNSTDNNLVLSDLLTKGIKLKRVEQQKQKKVDARDQLLEEIRTGKDLKPTEKNIVTPTRKPMKSIFVGTSLIDAIKTRRLNSHEDEDTSLDWLQ